MFTDVCMQKYPYQTKDFNNAQKIGINLENLSQMNDEYLVWCIFWQMYGDTTPSVCTAQAQLLKHTLHCRLQNCRKTRQHKICCEERYEYTKSCLDNWNDLFNLSIIKKWEDTKNIYDFKSYKIYTASILIGSSTAFGRVTFATVVWQQWLQQKIVLNW